MRRDVLADRRVRRAAAAVLAALAGLAAAGSPAPGRGAELLKPFKEKLQAALREGMSHGPDEAIGVCRRKAPEIARSLETNGVRMGRTSQRLRNPANTAPAWVGPILEEYVDGPGEPAPRTVPLPDGRQGYTEPIFVASVCLTCHGENVAPEIARRIAEHYPNDRAVGFRQGDFRGLFWVEYPERE